MADYLLDPVPVDVAAIKQQMVDQLQTLVPSVDPAPSTVWDVLFDCLAPIVAEDRQLLTGFSLLAVFRTWGQTLDIPQDPATSALATVTLTAVDTAGHTLAAGAPLTIADADVDQVAFVTTADAVIAPGNSTVTGVTIAAVTPGTDANGLQAGVQLEQTVAWVQSVTVDTPTAGGLDAESDAAWLNKVATVIKHSPPILPADFEAIARTIPGVARAVCKRSYNWGSFGVAETANAGGYVHVTVIGDDGTIGSPAITAVQTLLDAWRPAGVIVKVRGPMYTVLSVQFAGVALPGWTPSDVQARAIAAVQDFLNPGRWGQPAAGDDLDTPGVAGNWLDQRVLRYQDIVTVLNNVPGFSHYTSLTTQYYSNTPGTTDVNLNTNQGDLDRPNFPGLLPTVAAVTGTVVAP